MKKLLTIAVSVLMPLLVISGKAWADGAPFSIYSLVKTENVTPHVFSSSATVFTFNEGDTLSKIWLKKDGTTENLQRVASGLTDLTSVTERTGNFDMLPGFNFGETAVGYFGLTASGVMYFGQEDKLYAAENAYSYVTGLKTLFTNLVYMEFFTATGLYDMYNFSRQPAVAAANASVKVETVADTLYVGFEGLKIMDKPGKNPLTLSFQYMITANGNISLVPVSMQPIGNYDTVNGTNLYGFGWGLYRGPYSGNTADQGAFMGTSYNPKYYISESGGVPDNVLRVPVNAHCLLNKKVYPATGERYSFICPGPCAPVSDNRIVRWDYNLTSTTLDFNGVNSKMDWNEGNKLLLILSAKDSLYGSDLPQNGIEYEDGDVIGTSEGVLVGTVFNRHDLYSAQIPGKITGLTPATTYYIHAFPYSTQCVGIPQYNTNGVPKQKITTYPTAPLSIEVDPATINKDGFTLNINTSQRYILLQSTRQIPMDFAFNLEGTYEKDEIITIQWGRLRNEIYELKVLAPDTNAAKYVITGADSGTRYYYYVLTNHNHGTIYSDRHVFCGASTVTVLGEDGTFDMDFSTDADNTEALTHPAPAGWTFDARNATLFYLGSVSGSGKMLWTYLQKSVDPTTYEPIPAWVAATSPIIDKGMFEKASASFRFYCFSEGLLLGDYSHSKPNAGDSIIVQYQNTDQTEWHYLGAVTSADVFEKGFYTLYTPEFQPAQSFRFRIVVKSEYEAGTTSNRIGFLGLNVEASLPCKPVRELHLDPEATSFDMATLAWSNEGNIAGVEGFKIMYGEKDKDSLSTLFIGDKLSVEISNLQAKTNYVAKVEAICGANDTSLFRAVEFTTYSPLPYTFGAECRQIADPNNPEVSYRDCSMPGDVNFYTGTLPTSGAAVLEEYDNTYEVWSVVDDKTYDNLYPGLSAMNESCLNPMWLHFPVLAVGETRGTTVITLDMAAWGFNGTRQVSASFSSTDVCKLLISTTGRFTADDVVGTINLRSLNDSATKIAFTYNVTSPRLYMALYTKFKLNNDAAVHNTLLLKSLSIDWGQIVCEPATDIEQTPDKTSARISWKGEALEYAVIYKARRNQTVEDTVYTTSTAITLTGLQSGTAYQYYIIGYCEPNRGNPSEPSETKYFTTVQDCLVPELSLISTTWSTARFAISHCNAPRRLVHCWAKDRETYPNAEMSFAVERDTFRITEMYLIGLEVEYYIQVRAVCGTGDTTAWSDTLGFKTDPIPSCGHPTELKAVGNPARNEVTLTWKDGVNNQYQIITYRKKGETQYDTSYSDKQKFIVRNVQPNVLYTWRLRAFCDDFLYSATVSGPDFDLNTGVDNEAVGGFEKAIRVKAFKGQIVVENPANLYIKTLEIYTVDGKRQQFHAVNSAENLLLSHDLQKGLAIIKITGEGGKTATYKVIIL